MGWFKRDSRTDYEKYREYKEKRIALERQNESRRQVEDERKAYQKAKEENFRHSTSGRVLSGFHTIAKNVNAGLEKERKKTYPTKKKVKRKHTRGGITVVVNSGTGRATVRKRKSPKKKKPVKYDVWGGF